MHPLAAVTFPVLLGSHNDTRTARRKPKRIVTTAFAMRLLEVALKMPCGDARRDGLVKMGHRMRRCSIDESGWRCAQAFCPRCAARKSKRTGASLLTVVKRRTDQRALALVTATVAIDDLDIGHRELTGALSKLRRTRVWKRTFVGGQLHIEHQRSSGRMRRWNVHAHLLVEFGSPGPAREVEFKRRWKALLSARGFVGRFQLKRVTRV